jgi:DNA-binding LacI/PurR family transcriptional regulator
MAAKRPRIVDVARLAGVSEGTVSVVLNNRVGERVRVSEETQQKVWDAVRQLGYVANPVAQSLAGGQNRIIAVFTFESIFPLDSRNFYYPFLIGIEEEADTLGYDLLLVTGSNGSTTGSRHIFQNGINRLARADGAILLGHGDRAEVNRLIDENYPFVFVGRRDSPNDSISYAGADYAQAAAEIVDYLFQHHHRNIAYIKTTNTNESALNREVGIRQAHQRAGIHLPPSRMWSGAEDALTLDELQAFRQQGVTAFVAENDLLGGRILALTQAAGWQCPRDFSLAVLGDPLSLVESVYPWTTFKIPRLAMGRDAVRLLVRMLNEDDSDRETPYRSMLPCAFVPGQTVADARG